MGTPAHKKRAKYGVHPEAAKTFKRVYEPYAAALGHALIAWNRLHASLGGLFHEILKSRNNTLAHAIWHSSTNDATMHDALLAAARAKFGKTKKHLLADIECLVGEVSNLRADRNTTTHALLVIARAAPGSEQAFEVIPDVVTGHPKSKKLTGKSLIKEFVSCEDRASELSLFATALRWHMRHSSTHPWPEKPGLPLFPPKQTQAEQRQKRRDKQRQLRRRASRA